MTSRRIAAGTALILLLSGLSACRSDDARDAPGSAGESQGQRPGVGNGGSSGASSLQGGSPTSMGSPQGGSLSGAGGDVSLAGRNTAGVTSEAGATGGGATGPRGGAGGSATPAGGAMGGVGAGAAGAAGKGGAAASGGSNGASALIRNDTFWKDTAGNPIYSQGGGVLRVGTTYYWYGVRYGGAATYLMNPTKSNSDTSFVAVTVYSSTDLANWKFEGNALTPSSASGGATIDSSTWIGRVGAAYNATTKKYVLVGQYLGTPDTMQFFATSDTPAGPFEWDHTQAVVSNVVNDNCGDQSVFTDDDGKAYILCSSLSGRSNTYIIPLRPSDFLEAQPATRIFNGAGREGNAMFKYKGRYFVCSSDLHGWNASHAYYISATNIMGPYGAEAVIGGTDLDFSHVTQTGLFITVKGSVQETVIFGGDRWSDFAGNGLGFNQWMPLDFTGASPSMLSFSEWTIDAATGVVAVAAGNNYVLNPSFEADRVTTNVPAGWAATSGTNVQGGHSGRWSWQLSGAASLEQKVTGIPNGSYRLAVWAKGSTAILYAKPAGSDDKTASISTAAAFTQVSLSDIVVADGELQFGVSSSNGTVSLDDFTLIKN